MPVIFDQRVKACLVRDCSEDPTLHTAGPRAPCPNTQATPHASRRDSLRYRSGGGCQHATGATEATTRERISH